MMRPPEIYVNGPEDVLKQREPAPCGSAERLRKSVGPTTPAVTEAMRTPDRSELANDEPVEPLRPTRPDADFRQPAA